MSSKKSTTNQRKLFSALGLLGALGIVSVLSYNVIADVQLLNRDLNSILDFISSQITLPIGGLLIAIFVGWQVSRETSQKELSDLPTIAFNIWHMLIRYLLPAAITLILITGLNNRGG